MMSAEGRAMCRKKKRPKPNPTHQSLKPDGSKNNKGSYFRRIEDIEKGLRKIDASRLPSGGRFLFLYYGCEKLSKGIVGIAREWEACDAYKQNLVLADLKSAVKKLGLAVSDSELDVLFLIDRKNSSARHWRNEIVHNFGPSNVGNVVKHSAKLNQKMREFLESTTPEVLKYLEVNYAHLLP